MSPGLVVYKQLESHENSIKSHENLMSPMNI